MTPLLLQLDLIEDITECLSELRFPNPKGEDIAINVYKHDTPIMHHKDYGDLDYNETETGADSESPDLSEDSVETTEDDPFPYVIVRLSQGSVKRPDMPHTVDVVFIIGVYDAGESHTGQDGVLTVIDRIYERYAKNPIVHGSKAKIRFDGEQMLFHWVLQDDDTWPYYFGAIQAEFEVMPIEREEGNQYT